MLVQSDGTPNHQTDNFPTNYNPNPILRQNYLFHIPLAPKFTEKPTKTPFGPIGVAVNGIPSTTLTIAKAGMLSWGQTPRSSIPAADTPIRAGALSLS